MGESWSAVVMVFNVAPLQGFWKRFQLHGATTYLPKSGRPHVTKLRISLHLIMSYLRRDNHCRFYSHHFQPLGCQMVNIKNYNVFGNLHTKLVQYFYHPITSCSLFPRSKPLCLAEGKQNIYFGD